MRNTVHSYIDRFRHYRHERAVLGSVLLILALFVSITVYWQLRYVGITMTNETYCGYEEHVHTEECYEYTLICGLEESEGHSHTDECYEEQLVLICGLEESDGHTHTEDCYDEEGNLVCTLEECEGHTHTDECYETQLVLICGLEESEGHIHTEECYEKTLICGLEEHTHTVDCLIDLTADVEDATVWEATLPELTGDLRTDVVAIAYSQLGYTESTANYSIGDDGTTHYGYTRYGAWYGSSYADWDSVFVAFCLDYAGISDEFTYNAGAYAWSVDLTNLGYYGTADSYATSIGDIVFIDTDADGKANISAIVVSVGEESVTVIQGNYSITDSEGNTTDRVAFVSYSTVADAIETEVVTLSSESENETAEINPIILGYANISPEASEEEIAEEASADASEEEVVLDENADETITEEDTEIEIETEEVVILTSTATDYITQVNELYTLAISLTAGDTTTAESIWNSLMTIWEQIYAEEEAGTLTLTSEEYGKVNTLTDEIYYYFVETVGYDPYGVATLASTSTGTDSIYYTDGTTTLENSSVTWTASNVSYEDGSFTLELLATFTLSGLQIQPTNGEYATYYIYLPSGVTVSDDMLGVKMNGTDESSTTVTYHYYYRVDANGDYYIEIVFDEADYYNANNVDQELTGKIDYSHYAIAASSVGTEDGNVTISYGDGAKITIPANEIDKGDSESWLQDISISKSSASYDLTNNSITYTVYISSTSGTGVITLDDVMSVVANQSYSGSLTVTNVTVDSVYYQQNIYYSNEYGSWSSWNSETEVTSSNSTIDSNTTAGSDYNVSDTPTSGSDVTITLAPLAGGDGNNISGTSTTADRYVITYTVTFEEGSSTIDASVINEATATATKDGDTVTDEATSIRRVSTSTVSKTHTYNSDTGLITWTITFNANGSNIAGYTLSDDMLSQLLDDLSVSATYNGTSATTADGTDYTVNYENGVITGITFNAVDDDGDGNYDSNTRTYTITYTTDTGLGMGESGKLVYNEVDIYKGQTLVDEDEDSAWVYSSGSLNKSVSAAKDTTTATLNGTTVTARVLNWTSVLTVPSSGIDSESTIEDCLNGNWGYYSLSSTNQWFTYTQLTTFMETLTGTNGAITVVDSYGDTVDSLSYANGDYTISVYGYANDGSSGQTISYADILANPSTYQNYVFTEWKITLNKDISGPGTITFSYATTANIDVVETTQNYTNYIYVNNLSAYATYTERSKVYKTDGNGSSSATTTTTSSGDGTVTWKVYVNADGLSDTSGDFIITDTLPAGVTLQSVYIQLGYSGYSTTLTATTVSGNTTLSSGTLYNQTISGTVTSNGDGTTDVVITIPDDVYYIISEGASNPYIMLTYTTTIDDWDESGEFDDSSVTYDQTTNTYTRSYVLNNSVVVTLNGGSYGNDSQEQDINHTKQGEITSYTHDEVEKSGNYTTLSGTSNTNMVEYEVVLNLDGEDLLDGGDTLTFTDVLKTYDYATSTGQALYATLMRNTVKFYQLYKLEETTYESTGDTYTYVYTDDNNNSVTLYTGSTDITSWSSYESSVYPYTEVDGKITYYYMVQLDIEWDFVYDNTYAWDVTNTLTAEVPDSTPILVTYTYYITATGSSYIALYNTANLTGEGVVKGTETEGGGYSYTDPQSTGTISSAGGLTVYKSGAHSSITIEGVTFGLYVYNFTSGEFEEVLDDTTNEHVTYTTNSSGYLSVSPSYTYDDGGGNTVEAYYVWYKPNTVYCLKELSGPEGYLIDTETEYYFFWYDSTSTDYPYTSMVYPSGVTSSDVSAVTTKSNTTLSISNQPITTLTLTKVSSSDSTTTIPGATFALYRWSGSRSAWVKIGTYTTDASGKISITYDEDLFDYNRAYRLIEESTADGYNIAWDDVTEFYFYWSSDENGGEVTGPDGWGESGKYASVIDLSDGSQTVTATNSPTSTTISVQKVWIDENGSIVTDTTGYSSTVQLYYYVGDADGNPIRISGTTPASSLELITLTTSTGVSADTEVVFASGTAFTTGSTTVNNTFQKLQVSSASVISAIFDDNYSDTYIAVTVENSSSPGSLQVFVEGTYTDTGGTTSYPQLTTTYLSPSDVDTDSGTSVVYFSLSALRDLLESNYYVQDYMTRYGYTAEEAVTALWNSIDLWTTDGNDNNITLTSFKFVGSANTVKASDSGTSYSLSGSWGSSWHWVFSSSTELVNALKTEGSKILVTYTCSEVTEANGGTLVVGFRDGDTPQVSCDSYITVSSATSSAVTVAIDPSSLSNYSDLNFDNFQCLYITSNGITATVTSVSVVIPATSSTITQTYTYAETYDSAKPLTDSYSWYNFLSRSDDVLEAIQTDGAVIYISYTCTDAVPTRLRVGIQYSDNYSDPDWYDITSQISVGSGYIAVPVSSIVSKYSLSNYNEIEMDAVYGSSGGLVTINSVSILIPYDLTENISGTINSSGAYTIALYEPYLGGTVNGYVSINNSQAGQWNAITNSASEPTYDYTGVNSTVSHNLITGYAFLDAVYADLASTVEITVDVTAYDSSYDIESELKSLSFIIQGDKSVGNTDDGYVAIATVSPVSVTNVSGNTYTVTYNASDIVSALKNFNSAYTNAAAVYADYNALCLSMGSGDTSFAANVTGLRVLSEEFDVADFYTYSSLIGYDYGIPYTDENGTEFIYTLSDSNNWTVSVANLPLTYTVTDSQTGVSTTYYRYYYFVETAHTGGSVAYTTTYSQREGENGGGEIVITNIATTFVLPTTGWSGDYKTTYEFGIMLIILALCGAGIYRNISRIRKSLVSEPLQDKVDPIGNHERLPDVRNRKFVIPRIVRKGDTRAGPEDG